MSDVEENMNKRTINALTRETIEKMEQGIDVFCVADADELFQALGMSDDQHRELPDN
ncbi:TPA: hypothetical protein ACXYOX_004228 [Escherichia coli]